VAIEFLEECSDVEKERLQIMRLLERAARIKGAQCIAGVDEAGRGPLAGPVVAAACIIPEHLLIPEIDDSKKLTPAKRNSLYQKLTSHPNILYGIGIVSPKEIDRINIYQATIVAMEEALSKLACVPDLVLVDGMRLPNIPQSEKVVGGDALSYLIAAASILAKVTRDRLMLEHHAQWPEYGFDKHKGYSTQQHLEMIKKYGLCQIHRKSFAPCK
jgi:ribonuclease HII